MVAGKAKKKKTEKNEGFVFFLLRAAQMWADVMRCRKLRDAASTGGTWQDIQAEFQKDAGNPY